MNETKARFFDSIIFAEKYEVVRLAIFASGAGSNARNIIEYFRGSSEAEVALIISNNPKAGVLQIASDNDIPVLLIDKSDHKNPESLIGKLKLENIDLIVLAGYLWKIPEALVEAFDHRIVNIHPALLPKYGGKGMYGHHVHEAVFAHHEKESGITIHYVNAHYDEGAIIFQASVQINAEDDVQSIERKVRELEIRHYPVVIDRLIGTLKNS